MTGTSDAFIKKIDQFTALVWLPKLSILKLVKNGEILKQVTVEKDCKISTFEELCKQLTNNL